MIKWVLLSVVTGIGILFLYIGFALPDVGEAPYLKIDKTEARIKRGEYLANSVSVCMDCHSTRDWSQFSGPLVPGTLGKGGEVFNQKMGFPGAFYAKNITPDGIGEWTDGELLRAIASGVSKTGKALFPVMPHPNYGKMDKEDLISIIAYLRTLKTIKNKVPESRPDFPMNFIIKTIPTAATFSKKPKVTDQIKYGGYLFNATSCTDCHSKQEKGTKIAGMELAGGFEFPLPTGGIVRSANITQDKTTGIGNWTEAMFVKRFKIYAAKTYISPKIENGNFNTVMPWKMYANMKTEDLKAIYAYLKTIEPIKNKVVKFSKK
ncbi:MAG: hypothetical protein QG594_1244 [Bacteroidota bacterium]|nr:hypothetical protein [Bacteroidota bacterium]